MKNKFLLDTDVMIDFFRGRDEAADFLQRNISSLILSVVSITELYAGVRDSEKTHLEQTLLFLEMIQVTQPIAKLGGLILNQYHKSHGIELPDALIAATAVQKGYTLVSLNKKHFPMIDNLVVPYQK